MLPEETISRIISDIKFYEPLKNLALCSSQFHRITVPYLYSHVRLYIHYPPEVEGQQDHGTIPGKECYIYLRSLAALLLRKPEYAKCVRCFTMGTGLSGKSHPRFSTGNYICTGRDIELWEERFGTEEWQDAITDQPEVNEAFKQAIKKYSHSKGEEAEWLEDVAKRGHEDALLGFLLPTMINLQCLNLAITLNATYFARLIKRVVRKDKPFDSSPSFSALAEIVNIGNGMKYGVTSQHFVHYFDLPAIRSIYGHRLNSDRGEGADPILAALKPGTSSVTHLELRECLIDRVDLALMLGAPKSLKTFIFQSSNPTLLRYIVRSGLNTQKDSLENLWLDYPDSITWYHGSNIINDMALMTLFADFKVLRILRMGSTFIFGANGHTALTDEEKNQIRHRLVIGLPPTIETLLITHCAGHFERVLIAVEGLIEQKEQRFVHLKIIILEAPWPKMKMFWNGAAMLALLQLARAMGVDMIPMEDKSGTGPSLSSEWPEKKWGMDKNTKWADGGNGLVVQGVVDSFSEDEADGLIESLNDLHAPEIDSDWDSDDGYSNEKEVEVSEGEDEDADYED